MHMAIKTRRWVRADLDRLPDDGNTYEVVRGELFVSPPPRFEHQAVVTRLVHLIVPYLERNGIGLLHVPRSVFVFEANQVEPDLMVLPPGSLKSSWERMPVPLLAVEVLSD